MNSFQRVVLVAGLLVVAAMGAYPPWVTAPVTRAQAATELKFRTYDEAVRYVRSHYSGETFDTSRSSWITSAEYYHADGRGYLILGMRGKPYLFAKVPRAVWEEFKKASSLGRYYNEHIKGRYRLDVE